MPRNLKFHDSWKIAHWHKLIERKYRFAGCAEAARNYHANIFRVHMLTRLSSEAFMAGRIYSEARMGLVQELSGFQGTREEFDDRVWGRYLDICQGQSQDFRSGFSDDSMKKTELLFTHIKPLHQALEALLEQMVIQAWTAFEVMAEQLWKRAIKQRPKLDKRTGKERDWSGHRSRSKIANLYRFTFRTDNAAIMRAVDSHRVHALAIARNVLVHSGGAIDKGFSDDRKAYSEKGVKQRGGKYLKCIRGRRIGYRIPFTGPIVRRLVDPVTPLGFDLVRAVDRWLISH